VWPVVDSALARSNPVEPKFASGSVWQELLLRQVDGASTIHSAEETSTTEASSVLVNVR